MSGDAHAKLLAARDAPIARVVDARARPRPTGPPEVLAAAPDSLLLREGESFSFNELRDGEIVLRVLCDDERHAREWAEACAVLDWFQRHWAARDTDTIVEQRVAPAYRLVQHRRYDDAQVIGREAARDYYRRSLEFGVIVDVQLQAVRGPARLSRMVYSGEHGPNIGPTEDVVWAAYFEPETVVVRVDYYDTEDEARAAFQALAVLGDRRPEEILEVEPGRVVFREGGRLEELRVT